MRPDPALALRDISLADLARRSDGTLIGSDVPIQFFGFLGSVDVAPQTLTFTTSDRFMERFVDSPIAAAIIGSDAAADFDSQGKSVIVHDNPAEAFWSLHHDLALEARHGRLEGRRGRGVDIATSARVDDHAQIGDDVTVGHGAYIGQNVIIEDHATVGPGAVIGSDGFQASIVDRRRRLMPHVGGVRLGIGVSVGALSAVDSALFGTFTSAGTETMIDNHIQVGHNVSIGARCTIAAMSEISGHAHLDDDVWIAPGCSTLQFLSIGRGALVSVGSAVVRDVSAHTKVSGNPARPIGRVCLCRDSLAVDAESATCASCGRQYRLVEGRLVLIS
jgi:UDP-3-O-[3-hydroxymyristoyl] glucosamine N-acyltransferase